MDDAATTPADVSPKDNSIEDTGVLEKKKEDNPAMDDAETLPNVKEDPILDYAIHYAINNAYPLDLTKEKKRAVRKRAVTLSIDSGGFPEERVKVVQSRKDQLLIVKACHSEPTYGHFGL